MKRGGFLRLLGAAPVAGRGMPARVLWKPRSLGITSLLRDYERGLLDPGELSARLSSWGCTINFRESIRRTIAAHVAAGGDARALTFGPQFERMYREVLAETPRVSPGRSTGNPP